MITKIIIANADSEYKQFAEVIGYFGTYYITSTYAINQEIQKYQCPFRVSDYIDELKKENLIREIDETKVEQIDFIYDISAQSKVIADDILHGKYDYDNYLETTSHFDKYGVEL